MGKPAFEAWKAPVAELKKRVLNIDELPQCVVTLMASGMTVRSDDPFDMLQQQHRKTWALDMEAASFYFTLRARPDVDGLVVKGVCDYADLSKDDVYHGFAAHASAIYLFTFIQEYVTRDMLRRLLSETLPVFTVPFHRNPFFTGRQDILQQLHTHLALGGAAAITQSYAISGLGGIGKTQIAVEYAYQHYQDYQAVLWMLADSRESLVSGYIATAEELNLPQKDTQEQQIIIHAVNVWLQTHHSWLLILDNADELALLKDFLPPVVGGHLLITTRAQALGHLAQRLEVETFSSEDGMLFLLRRAALLAPDASLEQVSIEDRAFAAQIVLELGGLPLALDQAGAYLEETNTGLSDYLQIYHRHRVDLLRERRGQVADHPEPVATTWSLSFARVEQKSSAAADLLRLCAFLDPDAIPLEIVTQGASDLGPQLAPLARDAYLLDQAIQTLRSYSLVSRSPLTRTLSLHRLVQTVVRDALPVEERKQWMQRAVSAVNSILPDVEFAQWAVCERCLPHALVCATWIEREQMIFPGAARLLSQTGLYLAERGRYGEAEPLYRQALLIYEQKLGAEHPDTARNLHGLAVLYQRQGKYTEAESLMKQVLLIYEQKLGAEHPVRRIVGSYRAYRYPVLELMESSMHTSLTLTLERGRRP
jgi:tetratricopeptide (TPR) repeat protein